MALGTHSVLTRYSLSTHSVFTQYSLGTHSVVTPYSVIQELITPGSQLCEEKMPFMKDWWEMASVQRSGSHSLCLVFSLDVFGGTVRISVSGKRNKVKTLT